MPDSEPPIELTERVADFVAKLDAVAPGLLVSVHLTGSGSAGDWQHDSDIDLLFETTRPLAEIETAPISRLHAATAGGHAVDGVYLTSAEMASGPDVVKSAPQVVGGKFAPEQSGGQLTWVTWLEMLGGHSASAAAGRLGSWSAGAPMTRSGSLIAQRAAEASRANLRSYWLPYAVDALERMASRGGAEPVSGEVVEWIALGAQRLLVTIDTGAVVSKSEAAAYAAHRWPEYEDLLVRVLDSRRGGSQPFTVHDARLAAALVQDCVASAR